MSKISGAISCILIIVLAVVPSNTSPQGYIHELYVPSLDLSLESTNSSTSFGKTVNPSLFFDLSLTNVMANCDVHYRKINLTFSYGSQIVVASYVVPGSSVLGEKTYWRSVVETHGVPWADAVRAVSGGSTVVFGINVTAVRPLFICTNSETTTTTTTTTTMTTTTTTTSKFEGKNMDFWTGVEVDKSGMKVEKGSVSLSSSAPKSGLQICALLLVMIMTFTCLSI